MLVIKFLVSMYQVRQFIYLILFCLVIGFWCVLNTFIPLYVSTINVGMCCIPVIIAFLIRKKINKDIKENGLVVEV